MSCDVSKATEGLENELIIIIIIIIIIYSAEQLLYSDAKITLRFCLASPNTLHQS